MFGTFVPQRGKNTHGSTIYVSVLAFSEPQASHLTSPEPWFDCLQWRQDSSPGSEPDVGLALDRGW